MPKVPQKKGHIWVPRHVRKINGKKTMVEGHFRKKRRKTPKRLKTDEKITVGEGKNKTRMYIIRDEFGRIRGYSKTRKLK